MKKRATLLLPVGFEIDLDDSDLTLGELIALAQKAEDDPRIVPEDFGALKYFFFVITPRGSLIDTHVELSRTLASLCINDGDVVELRFCDPRPGSDGMILNPMRGVTKFVK